MVALSLGPAVVATLWSPKRNAEYPQDDTYRPVGVLRQKVQGHIGNGFHLATWENLVEQILIEDGKICTHFGFAAYIVS